MRFWICLASIFIMVACNTTPVSQQVSAEVQQVDSLSSTTINTEYASGFEISRLSEGYEIRTFNPGTKELHQKIIAPFEANYDLAVLSSTHIGMMEAIEALDKISQVAQRSYIYNEQIREGLDQGVISEAGAGGQINVELLLTSKAQIVTVADLDIMRFRPDLLKAADKQVVSILEWMEPTILGRLEWIKVFGALTGRLEQATAYFEQESGRYLQLKDSLKAVNHPKPKVIVGNQYNGTWHAPGGKSYMAQLIAQAGGDYMWQDNDEPGGVPLSYEQVLLQAKQADIWLNPGMHLTLPSLLVQDQRYVNFQPVINAAVYSHIKRRRADGGNDYWEQGVVQPSRVLLDLHMVFTQQQQTWYYQSLALE